ncbi:holin [Mycobacterium phage Anselm]|uniref:Holin n=1 Tax=Mycobacterium phage Anselm TaxID=2041517 RepID=A0A2D1G5B4_9CAUD|nr:holin [Mycobacterium phage Anselm]ATN87009.1 holin [Mycobacterium phage Anselm]
MKYSFPVIAKAVMAAVTAGLGAAAVAAGGPDLSVLSLGEILGCLGAALTAGGATFGTPNRDNTPPADKITKGIEEVIAARDAAQATVDQVTQTVGSVLSDVQLAANAINLGPLASQILNGVLPDHQPPTAYSLYDPSTAWRRPEDR